MTLSIAHVSSWCFIGNSNAIKHKTPLKNINAKKIT